MMALSHLNLLKLNLGKKTARGGDSPRRTPRGGMLGLALGGHRLEAVLLRRTNGTIRVQSSASGTLELNLLTDAPELVGREIRNHLDRVGIRERRCCICLPLEWALTAQVPVPDLPAEDVESFLSIEAERVFPLAAESISVVSSRCVSPEGVQFATLIGVPRDHLTVLQNVLKAAQLRPVSFSFGLPALQNPTPAGDGVAALAVGENSMELQVTCGGGIAALRTLEGALEQEGARKKPYADVVARDLRITLGQLPAELRQSVKRVRVFGQGEEIGRFVEDLRARAKFLSLDVELVSQLSPEVPGVHWEGVISVSAPTAAAGRLLAGQGSVFEFLPPKVSTWRQLTGRYSSQKMVAAGAIVGALALVMIGVFGVQQWQLTRWRTQWNRIRPQVTQLEAMQQQIRRFRPWFDGSYRTLSILQRMTEAFPEDGSVVAKTVEIRNPGIVSCTGTARDQQALLRVVDLLRGQKEFSGVKVDQIRGKQFTINLQWAEGGP